MNELHDKIIKAVEKIGKETVETNVAGKGNHPIIISENDLCCHLFRKLFKELNPEKYSITTEVYTNADESMRYLFNWDNIPGTDTENFRNFLKYDFDLCWVENAQITKSDDGKSVTINDGEHSLEIKPNKKEDRIIIYKYKYLLKENKVYDNKIRSDLVIFDKSESKYKLTNQGNPKEWDCEHYLAIMELKVNWSYDKKVTENHIIYDLWALSKLKEKSLSDSYYMIMFDFKGNHKKEELIKLTKEYRGIHLIYADIKNDKCPIYFNGDSTNLWV